MLACLADVMRMSKRVITFEEQLRECDRELRKIQRELQVVSDAVL